MTTNTPEQPMSPEELSERLGKIQPLMEDAGKAAMDVLKCSTRLIRESQDLMAEAYQSLKKTYEGLGSPNGDSLLGFFIWVKEQARLGEEGENG